MDCFWCKGEKNAKWQCYHCKTWLCDHCAESHFMDMPNMEAISKLDVQLVAARSMAESLTERTFKAEDKFKEAKDLLREFLYVEYCQWCNMDVEAHLAMKRDEPATFQHYMKVYEFVHGKSALEKLEKSLV